MNRTRRFDPDRRQRIITACLDVISRDGVEGTSHRKVAKEADVPLGSMTYHFEGREELIFLAFTQFAEETSVKFDRFMDATPTEASTEQLASFICDGIFASDRDLTLTLELYTLAARNPLFREITEAWMRRSRTTLERFYDPQTSRLVDALIEGLTIHRALDRQGQDPALARDGVERLTQSNWTSAGKHQG